MDSNRKTEWTVLEKLLLLVLCVFVVATNSENVSAQSLVYDDGDETEILEQADCEGILDAEWDKVLQEAGTPDEVIESFSETQKEFIADYLTGADVEEAEFSEYNTYVVEMPNSENDRKARTVFDATVYATSSTSLSSMMTITVTGYTVRSNGETQYDIFPTFKWTSTGYGIGNDSFAFALYSNWEAVPDTTVQMVVYLKNSSGTQQTKTYTDPSSASQYGYAFKIPKGECNAAPNGYYEGHAVFRARSSGSSTSTKRGITVAYIHDTSSSVKLSYGVNIGVASISVTIDSDKLKIYTKNTTF